MKMAKAKEGLWGKLLFILLALFIASKLVLLSSDTIVLWDETVYMSMGKYIYSGGSVGFWEEFRPPLLPVFLGPLWKLGGPGQGHIILSKLFAILISTVSIYSVWLLANKLLANAKKSFFAATIFAFTYIFFYYNSFAVMTDVFSAMLITLSLYFFVRGKNWLSGFFSGLAVLARFPSFILAAALLAACFFSKEKLTERLRNAAVFMFFFLAVLTPFLIHSKLAYGSFLHPLLSASEHASNPVHKHGILYYPLELLKWSPVFLLSFFALFRRPKLESLLQRRLAAPLLFFAFFIVYLYSIVNKQDRFLMPLLPLIAIAASEGFHLLKQFLSAKSKPYIAVVIVCILFLPMLYKDAWSFDFRNDEERNVTREFYKYFESHKPKGPVLTTDPVPAVYSDSKFIPLYYSVPNGSRIYESEKAKAYATIFTPEPFPCEALQEERCFKIRDEFFQKVLSENKLVFNKTFDGQHYYIFLNEKYAPTS